MSQNEFLHLLSYLDSDWYHTVPLNSITGSFLCKLTQLESSKAEYSNLGKKMAQILRYVAHKDRTNRYQMKCFEIYRFRRYKTLNFIPFRGKY